MTGAGKGTDPVRDASRPENWRLCAVLRAIPRTFARTWRGLVLADLTFKVFGALITLGYTSVVLSEVMARTGRSAVTNTDIATFLLNPEGLLLAFVGAAGTLFLVMVEQAVLMVVAAILYYRPQISGWGVAKAAGAAAHRIARLAGLLVFVALAVALPPAVTSALLYRAYLGGHDINFYLSTRPPVFLAVAGAAAAVMLGAAAVLAWFCVRALLAVPVLLFEGVSPVRAIRMSFARTRGSAWRVASLLALWHGSWFLLGVLCMAGARRLAGLAFHGVSSTPGAIGVASAALVGLSMVAAALSFGAWAGHALLLVRLYMSLDPAGAESPDPAPEPPGATERDGYLWRRAALAGALLLAAVLTVSALLVNGLSRLRHVQITAHRGYSKVAPENTLAAVRKAIEAGADWAEIDTQETKDGVVVVIHDRDLMRAAGDPRRVAEMTFADLRAIDVGTSHSPAFPGERVPSLEEVMNLARGKIKLNIELKYYGDDPRLAPDVARLIRKKGFESQCFVASLDYPKLLDAKAEDPALRTGAIISASVGDVTRLDADVLSVNAGLVDFRLMRKALRAGKEVHVWTVDDGRVAQVMMGRGVANIITNDPPRIIQARRTWEAMPPAEKLLLTVRYLLGFGEEKATEQIASQGEL